MRREKRCWKDGGGGSAGSMYALFSLFMVSMKSMTELVDPKYRNEYTKENLSKLFTSGRRFEHELPHCLTTCTHESSYVFCYVKRPKSKI